MEQLLAATGPERVTLAELWFHFVARSSSERQARIKLSSAIRNPILAEQLDLLAAKVKELRRGETEPRVAYNQKIPEAALADNVRMTFDFELSEARWKSPAAYYQYEEITVLRKAALALGPLPPSPAEKFATHAAVGAKPKFEYDRIVAEVVRRVYCGESDPSNVSLFTKDVLGWCQENLEKVPDEETLYTRMRRWLAALKQ